MRRPNGNAKRVRVWFSAVCLTLVAFGAQTANAPPASPPLSVLDVMRASVQVPADGIWAAQGADKLSDDEWLLADQDAVNLIVASTLISKAGTGKHDAQWVANPDWQSWTRDLQKTALQIRAAAIAKDKAK